MSYFGFWLRVLLPFMISLFLLSCKTLSPQTRSLINQHIVPQSKTISGVKNYSREDGDCGPAALAMLLDWSGKSIPLDEIRPKVYTPLKNGSLPSEMIAAARSYGMMSLKIKSMDAMVKELSVGHPMIALLNLGFSWLPTWHYVLVFGYNM